MVSEAFEVVLSLRTLALVLIVFGVAPGMVLRLLTLAFHPQDPRRAEIRAELHAVPTLERPIWVAQQLEVVLFEGLRDRVAWMLTGRLIYRWKFESGVENNARWPDTFWIPSDADKAAIVSGMHVRLIFSMRHGYGGDGWAERMWVDVTEVKGNRYVGTLRNTPVGIPKLYPDQLVRFTDDHIIDISDPNEDDAGDCSAAA